MNHKTQVLMAHLKSKMNEVNDLALKIIELEAREVLIKHHNTLTEFIMAMGSAFFTDKRGEVIMNGKLAYLKPIEDLICELNTELNICGNPMRFTASGPKITNW